LQTRRVSFRQTYSRHVQRHQLEAQQAAKNQQQAPVPGPTPGEPMTQELAEKHVHERYESLVKFLKESKGGNWKKSKEYQSVIKPEISKLLGVSPKEIAAPVEKTEELELEPAGEGSGLVS
jgi:hypothetical protein